MGKLGVKITPEITEYKERFLLGLTARQLAFSGIAVLLVVPTVIWGRKIIPVDVLMYVIAIEVIPPVVLGFVQLSGRSFEKTVKAMIEFYFGNQKRKAIYIPQEIKDCFKVRDIALAEEIRLRKEEIAENKRLKKTKAYKAEQREIKKAQKIKRKNMLKALKKAKKAKKRKS